MQRHSLSQWLLRAIVICLVIIDLYPIVWVILSSFKSNQQLSLMPMWSLPQSLNWGNYTAAWSVGHMSVYFRNSILTTIPSLFISLLLAAACAFAISCIRIRHGKKITFLFSAGIMVPVPMILLPMVYMFTKIHVINSLWSLLIAYTAAGLPLEVFMLTSYFASVPGEIIESAAMDGASIFQAFFRIALPMVSNALLTIGLVQFFFTWNDLFLSLTFIDSDSLRTIQTGLLNFQGEYGETEWGPMFAAITMALAPTIAVYLLLNKYVMRGLTSGALKG
ncbi:MAG: carbohydrate ABC transporter permease [Alicyclobacillus sp.]|nr:carbohydrate ABC transporter permease [Alicyclobacillus sp.]